MQSAETIREAVRAIAEYLRDFTSRQESVRKKDLLEESPSFDLLDQQ